MEEYRDWCGCLAGAMLAKTPPPDLPLRLAFPQVLERFPTASPLGAVLDPWFLVDREGREVSVVNGQKRALVGATSVTVKVEGDALRLTLSAEGDSLLELVANVDGSFSKAGGGRLYAGRRSSPLPEALVFANHPPMVFFANGAVVHGHVSFSPESPGEALLERQDIFKPLKWSGCDKTAEKPENRKGKAKSVFEFVEQELKSDGWKFVLTDDGKDEIGDFLALSPADALVNVLVVHCKAMKTDRPGADTLGNLNEVVAQAIRSQNHMQMPPSSFWPEIARRLDSRKRTKLLKGSAKAFKKGLEDWKGLSLQLDVAVIQPGLSLAAARQPGRGRNARILLESVLTLAEQTGGRLEVWCSD